MRRGRGAGSVSVSRQNAHSHAADRSANERAYLGWLSWRLVRQPSAALSHIGGAGIVKAPATVWSTAYDDGVMVILAVVLPPALPAYLVPTALRQGDVTAAWARVRPTGL